MVVDFAVVLLLCFLWVFLALVVFLEVSVGWLLLAAANRPGMATALSIIEAISFFIFISPLC